MELTLTDIQQASLPLVLTDEDGNQVSTPPTGTTAAYTTSDSTIATVAANPSDPTGLTALVVSVGKLGTATITATATIPGQATPFTGTLTVNVIASAPTSAGFGTPVISTQAGK